VKETTSEHFYKMMSFRDVGLLQLRTRKIVWPFV